MKIRQNQSGFGILETILLVVVIGLLVVVGWLVYDRQKKHDAATPTNTSKVTNFDECAKLHPVTASYPSTCVHEGKTYTQQVPSSQASDETDSWYLFTPQNNVYSVRIPDGWQAVSLYSNFYVREYKNLTYVSGKKATVQTLNEGGWDGASAVAIVNPGSYHDQIVREGNEIGTVKSADGKTAHKYYYQQTTEADGIGYPKGAKVYNYYFDAEGKYLQISHVVPQGETEHVDLVEKMLKTLKFN